MKELDEKDREMMQLLAQMGFGDIEARTLVFIGRRQPCTAREIELGVDLRQPQVSRAVNSMMRKGWVKRQIKKLEGQGRPIHIYKMKKDFGSIIRSKVDEKKEEIEQLKKTIKKIEKLAS